MSGYSDLDVFLIRRAYESELATLREQVKMLQKALGKIAILSDDAVTLRIANDVLEQTKPKDDKESSL